MKANKLLEPAWLPMFIDGDDEAGWIVVYQHSVTKKMRESALVFNTEEEAQECFDNGGKMPEDFSKMVDKLFGEAPQYH